MDIAYYQNDEAERTMIHRIINVCFEGGGRTEKNYTKAYSFIESGVGGQLWDEYYDLFKEYSPRFCGPINKHRSRDFNKQAKKMFSKWSHGATA
jgi:hypothetical protein